MSVIKSLGDNCLVLASDSMHQISEAFREEMGRKPTIHELCELLTEGLRACSDDVTTDGPNASIAIQGAVLERTRGKARRSNRGDVLLVPFKTENGLRYAVLICLGKAGRFGIAFGLCRDRLENAALPNAWSPSAFYEYPFFISDEFVKSGRWSVASHGADFVGLFRAPELFYHPSSDPGDGSYGAYGLAESVTGTIRHLDKKEAAAIFALTAGRYQAVYTGDRFEIFLSSIAARPQG